MTPAEQTYYTLCLAVWSLGLQIALERLGMASAIISASPTQNPFAPFLSLTSEGQGAMLH